MDIVIQFEQVSLYLIFRTVPLDLDNVGFLTSGVLPIAFIHYCSHFGPVEDF